MTRDLAEIERVKCGMRNFRRSWVEFIKVELGAEISSVFLCI